ncbi:MAG: Na+/H+ antiporter subunit E [Rickettsiaceae bacterium]|nr:Na+/H+ antiporter subunit E [Rickettsiaceae bacterium]
MLTKIISFLSLIIVWMGLMGVSYEPRMIIFMILVPTLVYVFSWKLNLLPKKNYFKIGSFFYFFWLLKEIFMSSIAVVKIACSKNLRIQPILEPIQSIQKNDMSLVIYANSITLTPGTVTLSMENNNLLVHALDISFMHDLQEGEMDNRVSKVIK